MGPLRSLLSRIMDFLIVVGQLLLFTFSLLLVGIWLTAFLAPSQAVMITVDSANEGVPELFLLSAVVPLLLLATLSTISLILKRNRVAPSTEEEVGKPQL